MHLANSKLHSEGFFSSPERSWDDVEVHKKVRSKIKIVNTLDQVQGEQSSLHFLTFRKLYCCVGYLLSWVGFSQKLVLGQGPINK